MPPVDAERGVEAKVSDSIYICSSPRRILCGIAWQFCLKVVARRGLNSAADKFEEEQLFFFCSRGIANRTEHLEFYSAVRVEVWIWLVFLILEICP